MTLEERQGRWRVTVLPSVEKVSRKKRLLEEFRQRPLFAVDASRCEVAFIAVDRRDEETYRRLRRRLR